MGRLYDVAKDYLYQEGRTKGREEGIEEGLTKGKEKVKRELIASALATGEFSTEQIAGYAKVTVAYVEAIARELKK